MVTNQEFLTAIFGDDAPRVLVTNFKLYNGSPSNWNVQYAGSSQTLEDPDRNQFYSCSLFNRNKRQQAFFENQYVFIIDDLGLGAGAKVSPDLLKGREFSFVIETSKDNYQAGIIFPTPESNIRSINSVTDAFIEQTLQLAIDPGMKGVTGLFRLPNGTNNKPKYPEPFRHKVHVWNPSYKRSLKDIVIEYGLTKPQAYRDLEKPIVDSNGGIRHLVTIETLRLAGLLTRQPKRDGNYFVPCPNSQAHSIDDGQTFYHPNYGFHCFHGGCHHMTTKVFVNWLKQYFTEAWIKAGGRV